MVSVNMIGSQNTDQPDRDRVGPADAGARWRDIAVTGLALTGPARERLHDVGMRHTTLVRHERDASPPYPKELLRLEALDGVPLTEERIATYWHRAPYVLPLRLARYAPLCVQPEVLDVAVIGTRGKRGEFDAHVATIAARLIEDAIVGTSRGPAGLSLDPAMPRTAARSRPAGIDHLIATWQTRLCSEWWSVGMAATPIADIVRTGATGPVRWLSPKRGEAYLADPFPWPGTDRLLCEEMPFSGGYGRIVALAPDQGGSWRQSAVVLDDAAHHSYPCAIQHGEITYFLPEATGRGATTLYRLMPDQDPVPLCAIAPGRRLADSTLFRHGGRWWIACTDLDIGSHDNLCLLHAADPLGPWLPHRCTPVKFDICGARPAGPVFTVGTELFRPGQDCALTYGAALVIHRIDELSPERYRETAVAWLRPDPAGPFPHGLHTLAVDQERVWVDGKRFELDLAGLRQKVGRAARRLVGRIGGIRH